MITFVRQLSHSQWIMLSTMVVISALLMLASRAEAYEPTYPQGTTLGHCGWVQAKQANYIKRKRNVRIIQSKLQSMGYSVGRTGIDGYYGHRTRAAVRNFQQANNLTVDGTVGHNTVSTLAYGSHPIANVRKCKHPYF